MASASETIITTSGAMMIVPYEWILENVGQEPMTIASKMISFRGEKVFRVGLKNHTQSPILFLMAVDLGKIGMKVEYVTYGIQGSGSSPATMFHIMRKEVTQVDLDEKYGSLQLFTTVLDKKIVGSCTFAFRIVITGTSDFYSYQLSDRLAKDQLWAALKNQQNLADVEFIVKDKKFPAHKSILAARSQMFADEFEKVQPVKDVPHLQIPIDGVEPSIVENFLHFVYTGEPIGTLADEDLQELADRYQLTTLSDLCKVALMKNDVMHMEKVRRTLNSNAEELSSSKIMPEKETEIFFDRTTPTFRCSTLTVKLESQVLFDDVKVVSTIRNYYYEIMDRKWLTDLWAAATDQILTDVEIFVGTVKVMEAHRVILSARSPVLNIVLNMISNTAGKSIVRFKAEFDVEVVKNFLNFLYTGSLKTTDSVHQLSKLAAMYEVETLKNVCQLLNPNSSDVE